MWEMQNSPLGSDGRGRRFHQKLPIPNEALLEIREPIINVTFLKKSNQFFGRAKRAKLTNSQTSN